MTNFTVIGYYESSGQTFAHTVKATDGGAALAALAAQFDDANFVCALESCAVASLYWPGEGVVDAQTVLEQPEVFGDAGAAEVQS